METYLVLAVIGDGVEGAGLVVPLEEMEKALERGALYARLYLVEGGLLPWEAAKALSERGYAVADEEDLPLGTEVEAVMVRDEDGVWVVWARVWNGFGEVVAEVSPEVMEEAAALFPQVRGLALFARL